MSSVIFWHDEAALSVQMFFNSHWTTLMSGDRFIVHGNGDRGMITAAMITQMSERQCPEGWLVIDESAPTGVIESIIVKIHRENRSGMQPQKVPAV